MIDIRIVALGGGACLAMNHLIKNYRGQNAWGEIRYIAIDTDPSDLLLSLAPTRIHIGQDCLFATEFSTNHDPAWGRRAIKESLDNIEKELIGADVLVLIASLGGGTGSAAEVIAARAREIVYTTLTVVTIPFGLEGKHRELVAWDAKRALISNTDSQLEIYCDRVIKSDRSLNLNEAFRKCNEVVSRAVEAVCGLYLKTGIINVVCADMSYMLRNSGTAAMVGIGSAKGLNQVEEATQRSIHSPILNYPLSRAKKVLLNITGLEDLSFADVTVIGEMVQNACHHDANITFNYIPEASGEGELTVTVFGLDID